MHELPGWLKHATVWLLLAVGLFLGVQAWQRQATQPRIEVAGGVVEIRRSADGHYHWPGSVGGQAVDFLVDTGATGTAIPAALARSLGLPVVGQVRSNTAGGVVNAEVVQGDLLLQGGLRAERLRMTALPDLQAPLLGMDVLGKLRWQQHQGVLRVELLGTAR
jgi:aspartyl protease family protein